MKRKSQDAEVYERELQQLYDGKIRRYLEYAEEILKQRKDETPQCSKHILEKLQSLDRQLEELLAKIKSEENYFSESEIRQIIPVVFVVFFGLGLYTKHIVLSFWRTWEKYVFAGMVACGTGLLGYTTYKRFHEHKQFQRLSWDIHRYKLEIAKLETEFDISLREIVRKQKTGHSFQSF